MSLIKKICTTKCAKCGGDMKRTEVHTVLVDQRPYQVCKDCAWDVETFLHQTPLAYGDYTPLEVTKEDVTET